MCGVLGFATNGVRNRRKFHKFVSKLFALTEERGKDASGYASLFYNKRKGIDYKIFEKAPMTASLFVRASDSFNKLFGRNKRGRTSQGQKR